LKTTSCKQILQIKNTQITSNIGTTAITEAMSMNRHLLLHRRNQADCSEPE